MGFTGWAYSGAIACAAIVICAIVARPSRPALREATLVFLLAVGVRLAAPALMALATGDSYWVTDPRPQSDEGVFTQLANTFVDNPRLLIDELMLRQNTRFGCVLYIMQSLAFDAGPPGLRMISLCAAVSGLLAVWAISRRRHGARAAVFPTVVAVVWPFAASHDASYFREPWLTFVTGWSLLWITVFEDRRWLRGFGVAAGAYLGYLIQPIAGMSMVMAYGLTDVARGIRAMPSRLRKPAWAMAALCSTVVVGVVAMRAFFGETDVLEQLDYQARFRAGGAAYKMASLQSASLAFVILMNVIQYFVGIVFVGVGGAKRLMALADYLQWLPVYGYIGYRLWQGKWERYGRPEQYALGVFGFYNLVSAVYVTNVAWAIRKRNSVAICVFMLLAGAIRKAEQLAQERRQKAFEMRTAQSEASPHPEGSIG